MSQQLKEALSFLSELKENNNREWFNEHKPRYESHKNFIKSVFEEVQTKMESYDEIEKLKIFRIYRDIRFSKDKTPFKTHFSCSFVRRGRERRGGYYLHLEPNNSFMACGFWNPSKEDLLRIRQEIAADPDEFKEVVSHSTLHKFWGELQGDALKKAPKGFSPDQAGIEFIRFKQFVFIKKLELKQVLDPDFSTEVSNGFKTISVFFEYMSDVLTTDANGQSLL